MIRIPTKIRYGTRAMLDLGLNYGNGLILLKEIAKRQEISVGYLEQIIPGLKAAGLVNSSRGAHGGYVLAKEPADITLKEIISALEGPLSLVECISDPDSCERADICITRDIWDDLGAIIDDFLLSITLQQLIGKYRSKQRSCSLMYNI
ncbi:MAG TPA: AsnC family transcriptional regulator [Actinobacteria bacterium]|nr:AsnC family transcriptional regulator [Actinomycetota bacterium]